MQDFAEQMLLDGLSCLLVLEKVIISQLCRVESYVYDQNHFTEIDPMADLRAEDAPSPCVSSTPFN